jgi:hypothetical protein
VRTRAIRAVATIALVAASWEVWQYAPDALAPIGLDGLDIPGRVAALFLFLSVAEMLFVRLWRQR